MATRRPPPSRSRTSTIFNPPRSKSIRGLPNSTEDQPDVPPLPHSNSISKHLKSDSETNIQVVIRCRRRSDREIQENSPIIVSSQGAKSHDVTIETSTPISSLGVVTLPPTR